MVVWLEIPVSDMDRAKAFTKLFFKVKINIVDFGGLLMGWFPDRGNANGVTGTLIKQKSYIPSQEGALVYCGSKDVQNELDRIEKAGGKIHQPKTQISPEHGYMVFFY